MLAPDLRESARFTSRIYASAFFWSQSGFNFARQQVKQTFGGKVQNE